MSTFLQTSASFRQGAHTMPGEYYTSPEIFAEEMETLFARSWVCVGRSSRLAEPGDFFVKVVAGESLILLRDRSGGLRAFFNVCRHRGTRLCSEESGHVSETIQCQYHAWTYTTDGRLIGAPHMGEVAGFNKTDYPLHQAALAEWEGFLFVNVAKQPEPFEQTHAPLIGRFSRFALHGLKVGHKVSYDVAANWKLIFQNYNECLHCPVIHPELSARMPYQSGANDLTEGPFLGGYMVISEPAVSVTMSGGAVGRPIAELPVEDRRRAYYYSFQPNMLLSIQPDYVNSHLMFPTGPTSVRIVYDWLFEPRHLPLPEADLQHYTALWEVTNAQDARNCEWQQEGMRSREFRHGHYVPQEFDCHRFAQWVRRGLGEG